MELKNRKASFDYHFEETEVAGVVLTGTEIKSLRGGHGSLTESYITINEDNEVWLRKMYIAPYKDGGYSNHETVRDRKLLMTKNQIKKWFEEVKVNKSLTIIPTKGFFTKKGVFKLVIALAKGKKDYDKRNDLKKKDDDRKVSQYLKDGRD